MLGLYPERIVKVSVDCLEPLSCASWKGDLLVIGIYETALSSSESGGQKQVSIAEGSLQQLDGELNQYISELLSVHDFTAKQGTSCFARYGGNARVVGLVGLGPAAQAQAVVAWGRSAFQDAGAAVATAAAAHKAASAAIAIMPAADAPASMADIAEKLALGVILGNYKATRHKGKPQRSPLTAVSILAPGVDDAPVTKAAQVAKGVLLARGLVESPANLCTPQHMADAAASVAESAPDCMQLKVLEREECEKLGMGLYLGVAECSALPPKFIHLTYTPSGASKKTIALVGKGLTFDSGGYNLKVGGMIEMMKFDMGGGGAVLGAAQIIAARKPPGVTIHFISAACENMVDGKGMRPGDILTSASGKTVEIDNTDAEGRLTLADALWYAQTHCHAASIVNIATLTGACMIALGKQVAGMFTPSDAVADSLTSASRESGEKLWRLPMEQTYLKNLDSPIADLKNTGIGNRYGSAITASLFLKEFVDTTKVDWAHLDIAGPAWREEEGGATGYGAHLLAEWATAQGNVSRD